MAPTATRPGLGRRAAIARRWQDGRIPADDPAKRSEAQIAHDYLLRADPRLAVLVARQGPVDPYVWSGIPVADGDRLGGLVLHIVSQQISTAVALLLYDRVVTLLGGRIDAAGLAAAAAEDEFRDAGLPHAKARTLRGLGESLELRRPDIFPAGDVALRAAMARIDERPLTPGPREAAGRAEIWRPYRSYAAAHLWAANRARREF